MPGEKIAQWCTALVTAERLGCKFECRGSGFVVFGRTPWDAERKHARLVAARGGAL